MFRDYVFFFNDTATTEIYTLSLHDALPIFANPIVERCEVGVERLRRRTVRPRLHEFGVRGEAFRGIRAHKVRRVNRSEEHTSELQSRQYLVCRLLLEKKNKNSVISTPHTNS